MSVRYYFQTGSMGGYWMGEYTVEQALKRAVEDAGNGYEPLRICQDGKVVYDQAALQAYITARKDAENVSSGMG